VLVEPKLSTEFNEKTSEEIETDNNGCAQNTQRVARKRPLCDETISASKVNDQSNHDTTSDSMKKMKVEQ
jgi:hypothetical protein